MRTKRRELKELRQGGKSGCAAAAADLVSDRHRRQLFAEGQLDRIDSYYELLKMIAGAGMGLAGNGVGMLRTRRRDISIKPNRKLDRKSSRGMIYENEELRLRTIHINAEVEQGQNDIKKLRRENEQLRREIWSLRDEYDKLEEILKKQKSREESGEPEDRSEDEASESDSEDDEEDEEDESDYEEEENEGHDKEERLENAENQKISSEKLNNTTITPLRTRLNFDDLPVVEEEEEIKKEKTNKENDQQQPRGDPSLQVSRAQPNDVPYCKSSHEQTDLLGTTAMSFGYQTDCPFAFPPPAGETSSYSNILPLDGSCLLMTNCPQLYVPSCTSQESEIPLGAVTTSSFELSPNLMDVGAHSHSPLPPPPAGWQSNVSTSIGESLITTSNFPPLVAGTQSMPPIYDSRLVSSKDSTLLVKQPQPLLPDDTRINVENGQTTIASTHAKLTAVPSLAERRKIFFKQNTYDFDANKSKDFNNPANSNTSEKILEDCNTRKNDPEAVSSESIKTDTSMTIDNGPKHFFAPLPAKSKFLYNDESSIRSMDDSNTTRHSDSGCSPSSENSMSTVISRERYNYKKGTADICVNGAVPCNGSSQIDKNDSKTFFSTENFLIVSDMRKNTNTNRFSSLLTKSVSCQDLSSCVPFTENLKSSNKNRQLTKSDNTLDSMSLSCKAFKSQLSMGQKQTGSRKSPSPDTPEIPKLPSIDYKLFNNPFLQNFEQAYQNFPVRTEGPSPVTHPLSIQVCESPVFGASISNPVKVQPTFSGPSITEPDCGTCKRKDLERLRLMISPSKLVDSKGEAQEYHVTSFETPSPQTMQIPPMTPYELEALRRMPTGTTTPIPQTPRLYQNVPFVPRGAAVYCPGQGMRMYYDTASMKVPAQTQTSLEDEITTSQGDGETKTADSNQPSSNHPKKRRSRKEKSGSIKDKRRSPSSVRRKDHLKKQTSVTSRDVPESPGKASTKTRFSETQEDIKNDSRSSSSGQESPKKDQTKRVSLYFSTKKRPSLSSVRTSRSRSVENARERVLTRGEAAQLEATNSERERTNSISSRELGAREKTRKGSTSSGSVPWCACWGNGCV